MKTDGRRGKSEASERRKQFRRQCMDYAVLTAQSGFEANTGARWFMRNAVITYLAKSSFLPESVHKDVQNLYQSVVNERVWIGDFADICRFLAPVLGHLFDIERDLKELSDAQISVLRGMMLKMAGTERFDDVRRIGWAYQYYRSEAHEAVIDVIAKKAVAAKDIPAATQLFTPDWTARFLVENCIFRAWGRGRLLTKEMQSRILGAEKNSEESRKYIEKLEELRLFDPCLGCGHILLAAYDCLASIYAEEGIETAQAARRILEENLYGCDIDEAVVDIAQACLVLRAARDDASIWNNPVRCQLKTLKFPASMPKDLFEEIAKSCVTRKKHIDPGADALAQIELYGSLLWIDDAEWEKLRKKLVDLAQTYREYRDLADFVECVDMLQAGYHVVCTNPPYLNKLIGELKDYLKRYLKPFHRDLFAAFAARNLRLCDGGFCGFMTPNVWLTLKSYAGMRRELLEKYSLECLVEPGRGTYFDEATVDLCAFVVGKNPRTGPGTYVQLPAVRGADAQCAAYESVLARPDSPERYEIDAASFLAIPECAMTFAMTDGIRRLFESCPPVSSAASVKQGLATTHNARFLRRWFEIPIDEIDFSAANTAEAKARGRRWFPYNKGGEFCRWYGNQTYIVDYFNDGAAIKENVMKRYPYLNSPDYVVKNTQYYFRRCLSWTKVSSGDTAFRYFPDGFIFDVAGCCLFFDDMPSLYYAAGFLNSSACREVLRAISPTLNYETGHIASLPMPDAGEAREKVVAEVKKCIEISKLIWDSREISWNFDAPPMIKVMKRGSLAERYEAVVKSHDDITRALVSSEQAIDAIFSAAAGIDACREHTPHAVPDAGDEAWRIILYFASRCLGRYGACPCEPWLFLYRTPMIGMQEHPHDFSRSLESSISDLCGADALGGSMSWLADHLEGFVSDKSRMPGSDLERIYRSVFEKFADIHRDTFLHRPFLWVWCVSPNLRIILDCHRLRESDLSALWHEASAAAGEIGDTWTVRPEDYRAFCEEIAALDIDDGVEINYEKIARWIELA